MQYSTLLLFIIFSVSSLATHEPSLNSKKHCMVIRLHCPEGTEHVTDQNGRCGCLGEKDYYPAQQCKKNQLICNSSATYSEFFTEAEDSDDRDVLMGCGCFKTSH